MPPAHTPKPFRMAPVAFGVALVLLGFLLLAERTAPEAARRIAHWWPLLLSLVALGRMVDRGPFHLGAHILMGLSFVLLAASFQRMDLVDRYWPLGVIWLGLVITGCAFAPRRACPDSDSTPEGDA